MIKLLPAVVLLMAAVAQDPAEPETKPVTSWSDSLTVTQVKALPETQSTENIHYTLVRDSESWSALWKNLNRDVPQADFEKGFVLLVYYAKWPGSFELGHPAVKEKAVHIELALDGAALKEQEESQEKEQTSPSDSPTSGDSRFIEISTPYCHYQFEMRYIARDGIDRVVLRHDGAGLATLLLEEKS